ncbi:Uncharacterised protein [Amycolatopsis camponoti]|uniref:Uncharacterized protein n=1 Tax=Amycolatopsis camponoti TaxID=2606593 RepID=A0A6I8LJ53_9PSEU|nr:Uncharacterised protein [Amycolatopsis camponoti]
MFPARQPSAVAPACRRGVTSAIGAVGLAMAADAAVQSV